MSGLDDVIQKESRFRGGAIFMKTNFFSFETIYTDKLCTMCIKKVKKLKVNQILISCLLTDMVYGSSTELSVELFGPQTTEVLNGEGPEMQNIVP